MLLWILDNNAISSLVPTPSVPATKTGSSYSLGTENSAPKPPRPPRTSFLLVSFAIDLIFFTSNSPASIFTPESL